jgi:hypothetical protein
VPEDRDAIEPRFCHSGVVHEWTREFFSEHAMDAWRRSRSPELTQAEVEFLVQALELDDGPKHLLDVPGDLSCTVDVDGDAIARPPRKTGAL